MHNKRRHSKMWPRQHHRKTARQTRIGRDRLPQFQQSLFRGGLCRESSRRNRPGPWRAAFSTTSTCFDQSPAGRDSGQYLRGLFAKQANERSNIQPVVEMAVRARTQRFKYHRDAEGPIVASDVRWLPKSARDQSLYSAQLRRIFWFSRSSQNYNDNGQAVAFAWICLLRRKR